MITHIVMWKLKDGASESEKQQNALKMKSMLESLSTKIQELKHLEVGLQALEGEEVSLSDVVLTTRFESQEDLQTYAAHPEHQKVVAFISKVTDERRVVDYLS